jgi:hypothetical protein
MSDGGNERQLEAGMEPVARLDDELYGHETLGIHYLGNAERARRIVVWHHVTSLRLLMPQAYMPTSWVITAEHCDGAGL